MRDYLKNNLKNKNYKIMTIKIQQIYGIPKELREPEPFPSLGRKTYFLPQDTYFYFFLKKILQ